MLICPFHNHCTQTLHSAGISLFRAIPRLYRLFRKYHIFFLPYIFPPFILFPFKIIPCFTICFSSVSIKTFASFTCHGVFDFRLVDGFATQRKRTFCRLVFFISTHLCTSIFYIQPYLDFGFNSQINCDRVNLEH